METEKQNQNNFLTIPLAIVVAGIVIGGAIFFGARGARVGDNTTGTNKESAAVAASDVTLKAVDASDHLRGNPEAPVVLVEYSDTECPFCKSFQGTMQKLMDSYGKDGSLAWVYRHFPLDQIHPKTRKEAEGAECAAELGGNTAFWTYLDRIFEVTPSNNGLDAAEIPKIAAYAKLDAKKFADCFASGKYADTIQKDYEDGLRAGATGTPFSVLVLKNALTSAQEVALAPTVARTQGGLAFSADKTKITLNGAFPYEMVKTVLDVVLK